MPVTMPVTAFGEGNLYRLTDAFETVPPWPDKMPPMA